MHDLECSIKHGLCLVALVGSNTGTFTGVVITVLNMGFVW